MSCIGEIMQQVNSLQQLRVRVYIKIYIYKYIYSRNAEKERPILCYSEFRAKALVRQTITESHSELH